MRVMPVLYVLIVHLRYNYVTWRGPFRNITNITHFFEEKTILSNCFRAHIEIIKIVYVHGIF